MVEAQNYDCFGKEVFWLVVVVSVVLQTPYDCNNHAAAATPANDFYLSAT